MGLAAVTPSGGGGGSPSGWTGTKVNQLIGLFTALVITIGGAYVIPLSGNTASAGECIIAARGQYVDSSFTVGSATRYYSVIDTVEFMHVATPHSRGHEFVNQQSWTYYWYTDNNGFYLLGTDSTAYNQQGGPGSLACLMPPTNFGNLTLQEATDLMRGTAWNLRETPSL